MAQSRRHSFVLSMAQGLATATRARLPPSSSRAAAASIRVFQVSSAIPATYRRFGQPAPSPAQQQRQQRQQQTAPQLLSLQSLGDILIQRSRGGGQSAGGGGRGRGGGGGWGGRSKAFAPRQTLLYVILGAAGVYYVVHLERVPETGRWRFIDVSREQEISMGEDAYRQVLQEYRGKILSHSHPHSRYVRKTAARIISALEGNQHTEVRSGSVGGALSQRDDGGQDAGFSGPLPSRGLRQKTEWEVFVIDEPSEKNAFVLPGGKVFVFTGILPICSNEDGLATVLGHEIAHQVVRHSAEKVSGYKVLMVGALLLESLVGVDAGLSRAGLTLLLSLPNSRKMELEADKIGLSIMAKACYDPREAGKLWQRMQESEDGGGNGGFGDAAKAILSTHPINSKRIQKMQEWLPEAMSTRGQSGCPNPDNILSFSSVVGGAFA